MDLAAELLQARADYAALKGERDGLLELSNSLRCSVVRLKAQVAASSSATIAAHAAAGSSSSSSSSSFSHAQAGAPATVARISQLEGALQAVSAQNAALQGDLHRLLAVAAAAASARGGQGQGQQGQGQQQGPGSHAAGGGTRAVAEEAQWVPVDTGAVGSSSSGSVSGSGNSVLSFSLVQGGQRLPASGGVSQAAPRQQQQAAAAAAAAAPRAVSLSPQVLPMRPASSQAVNAAPQQQQQQQQQQQHGQGAAEAKAKAAALAAAQRVNKVPNYAKLAKEGQ